MRIELEVRTAVALLLVVLIVVSTGGTIVGLLTTDQPGPNSFDDETVELNDGSELWPYTSRATSHAERTLPINLVLYGPTTYTEYVLRVAPTSEWEDLPEEREDIAPTEGDDLNESTLGWGGASGADRYIWVDPVGGEGPMWLSESYQLEQGDYLGARQHLRGYEDPAGGQWTAIQGHDEHWDWFHLRHTVHSIEATQNTIERELARSIFATDYYREHFRNDRGSDANGWVTIVILDEDLLPIVFGTLVLFGATSTRRDLENLLPTDPAITAGLRATFLMSALGGAYLAIRFGAIALERWFEAAPPKLIVTLAYPGLVVGLPVIAYLSARRLDATVAFWAAAIGFVAAILVDYTYLGVIRLPVETFVHRFALAIAIGMIAAGASETARYPGEFRGYVRTGVLLWVVAIVLPLLQFL